MDKKVIAFTVEFDFHKRMADYLHSLPERKSMKSYISELIQKDLDEKLKLQENKIQPKAEVKEDAKAEKKVDAKVEKKNEKTKEENKEKTDSKNRIDDIKAKIDNVKPKANNVKNKIKEEEEEFE